MLASTTFTGFSAAVLLSLCTTAATQHLLQHFLQHLAFCLCAQTLFTAGINHFHFMVLGASGNNSDGDFSVIQLLGLLCYVITERILQRIIR